jgi:hypothetical protein
MRQSQRTGRRRGVLTMELLLVFPILFALLLAMVQFSLTLHARQQLVAASREGARVAALGGDLDEVRAAVQRTLGRGRLADAAVHLTDGRGEEIAGGQAVPSGTAVAVWVRLPARHVVPDLLRFVGYSIKKDVLLARTAMRRE